MCCLYVRVGLRRAVGQARAQQEAVLSTRRLLAHAWRYTNTRHSLQRRDEG